MEQQQKLKQTLLSILKNKSNQSSTYRKAFIIYESILQSTKEIQNFQKNYANTNANFALFIFGSVLKLIPKDLSNFKYSVDSIFLLLSQTLPLINITTLKTSGILKKLRTQIFTILKNYQGAQRTPLMIRLGTHILGYTLINIDKIQNDNESNDILCELLNIAVHSYRTNILSKQVSKMLIGLVKNNENVAKILSKYVNNNLLMNINQNLYLNNVREVIQKFPLQLINDIGYRVCKYIKTIQCINENEQIYLAQIYYFLQKLSNKYTAQTLQQICKELINNIPSSINKQNKVWFCYVQTLYGIFQGLLLMNQRTANKYISVVVSILQEFVMKGDKIGKQAVSTLRALMSNCVKKSLWVRNRGGSKSSESQDLQNFDDMRLGDQKQNNFIKLISLLQSMLNDQYTNYKQTASILINFINSLDKSAFDDVIGFIDKIIKFRQKFQDKIFRKIICAIFDVFTVKKLCQIYRVGISGDIGDDGFQQKNNLWMVYCTEKYDGQQDFETFMIYYFPLLQQIKQILQNSNIPQIRRDAYKILQQQIWRGLKIFCKRPSQQYNYQPFIARIKSQISTKNTHNLIHIIMGLQNLCIKLYQKQYECKWSSNLISILAKNITREQNNTKQILKIIKYLSLITDKQYINRVFDKNIIKLIQEKQKLTIYQEHNFYINFKNFDILIAISNGINFYDPTVVAPFQISREELVVKFVGLIIGDDNIFQKKAYKFMFETIGLMGQSYYNEVVQLLQANQHRVMPTSKHYRLSILLYLWKTVSKSEQNLSPQLQFIKKYLPQILLSMREQNQRTRKQALQIFDQFCEKISQIQLLNNFIQILCAGLAVDSIEMKVATLNGLVIIYKKKYQLPIQFSIQILGIVLILIYEQKNQIYKLIIQFSKRFIFMYEKNKQISNILMIILNQIFKIKQSIKLDNRNIIKFFLLKLIKKFGKQQIQMYIDVNNKKIVTNAIKVENRIKKKKKLKFFRKKQFNNNPKQQDDQSQSQEQNLQQPLNYDLNQQMDIEQQNKQQLKQLENTDNLLLKYDLQQQNFHFEQDKLQKKGPQKAQKAAKDKQSNDITFQNGIMVIKQSPRRPRQRKFSHNQQQPFHQNNPQPSYNPYINIKKKKRDNEIHEIKQSGVTFRSNRAGGDVRIKDKPQPYAFIQFNSKALNKRFKKKAEKVFQTIFQKSQGGLKGIKSKISRKGHF